MNATRDPETILAAWLDEGPIDLPDATRRAILTALPTTPQARRGRIAPWRFSPMNTYSRLAIAAVIAVIAIGGALYLIGPRLGVGPSPTPSATPTATGPVSAGPVILTDTGCTWESNPGTLPNSVSALQFEFRNETDDYAAFFLHWVRPGHTWEEGVAFVADLQRRLISGEDWPPNEISVAVADVGLAARGTQQVSWGGWAFEPGYYGVICSANTSPTGDVLTTFLVGPLQLVGESPKSSPSG
jgi:hypothetical protein